MTLYKFALVYKLFIFDQRMFNPCRHYVNIFYYNCLSFLFVIGLTFDLAGHEFKDCVGLPKEKQGEVLRDLIFWKILTSF